MDLRVHPQDESTWRASLFQCYPDTEESRAGVAETPWRKLWKPGRAGGRGRGRASLDPRPVSPAGGPVAGSWAPGSPCALGQATWLRPGVCLCLSRCIQGRAALGYCGRAPLWHHHTPFLILSIPTLGSGFGAPPSSSRLSSSILSTGTLYLTSRYFLGLQNHCRW